MSFDELLGEWMAAQREAKGLSQQYLAEQLGIEQPTVSKIERGQRRLSVGEFLRWTDIVGIPEDQLGTTVAELRRSGSTAGYWYRAVGDD